MRKILSMLISIIFIFSAVSCASTEEIVPEYIASVGEIDLGGRTMTMALVPDYFFEGDNSTLGYINDTDFGDLAVQRLQDVENKYNVTIEFDYVGRAGDAAYKTVASGEQKYDFVSEETYYLVGYIASGIFEDLALLDNINVFNEEKWGNKQMLMSALWDGGVYGVLPAAHPFRVTNSQSNLLCINENLIINLLATDPRDYFENGEWNWETFNKVLRDYTHTNNSGETVYALVSGFGGFSRELAMCNGNEFITFDSNGAFEMGYFTPSAIEAYYQAFEWFYGDTKGCVSNQGELFLSENAVMTNTGTSGLLATTSSIAYTMDNFGIVPIPYGPNGNPKDYKISYISAYFMHAIPINARNVEESALILDAIYEPFEGFETKNQILDYLERNYFSDRRDAELYLSVSEENHTYYHSHHGLSSMFDQMPDLGVMKAVDSFRDSYYNFVEKSMIPMHQTAQDLFK